MPNVMVALPNIGGALCSTPQSLADAHYYRCRAVTLPRRKKVAKNRHLGTIAQLCRAIIFANKARIDNRKKLVKQQYVLHTSPQYGELWPTSG